MVFHFDSFQKPRQLWSRLLICHGYLAKRLTRLLFGDYRLVTHFDKWVNEGWLCFPVCDDLMKVIESILYLICSKQRRLRAEKAVLDVVHCRVQIFLLTSECYSLWVPFISRAAVLRDIPVRISISRSVNPCSRNVRIF